MLNQDNNLDNKTWRDLEEFVNDKDFSTIMQRDFPRETEVLRRGGMGRRDFLKLMGASVMMGGLTLTGCTTTPRQEEIIPYVNMPEGMIPGHPLYFASTMVLGGYATGVLIETHTGRPTRVDGNPNHPASLGASNAMLLASIFELYNPDRSTNVRHNGTVSDMGSFMSALDDVREQLNNGEGLRILTGVVSSPTLADHLDEVVGQFPNAEWYQYEPLARDNVHAGAEMAFGDVVNTVYDFSQANVILDLDADFLTSLPGSLAYARQFADGRRVRSESQIMNRLYAVESVPGNTGAIADHRLSLRAGDVATLALALADALDAEGGQAIDDAPWSQEFFDALVTDLRAAGSRAVVVVGDGQPAAVHALGHAINAVLGSVGTTINYTESVIAKPNNSISDLSAFVSDLTSGNVAAAFVLGGNPVYDAPVNVGLASALDRVPFSVHVSLYNDETSQSVGWHIPATHYIEAWGDARAYDGTLSVIQPPIGAMWENARSEHEILAAIAGDDRSGYDIVRAFNSDLDDATWRRALHDGVVADSAFEPVSVALSSSLADDVASALSNRGGEGLELIFLTDEATYDGRFAHNSWLLELPRAISKLSWDNVAIISPQTASDLNVSTGDLVELTLSGRTMEAPILVQDMMVNDAVGISLGYGRGITPELESGLSFNAYQLRTTDAMYFTNGLTVNRSQRTYPLAIIQKEFDDLGTHPVRYATLEEFVSHPDFAEESHTEATLISPDEWDYSQGYSWGMTIELTSCIGCNACIMGCVTENNSPSVGKAEVLQERDMHWLRVDRYNFGDGSSHFQPVPCMQCESAPCEPVCPVQATVHDHEGINNMVYNRCIGTRSCAANCPYSVRRFNFKEYVSDDSLLAEQRNPDVSTRVRGVMEKCNYCIQRINEARIASSTNGRPGIMDGDVTPACAQACPTQAISFGNLNDGNAVVTRNKQQPLNYSLLEELNTLPRTTYLARVTNPNVTIYDGPVSWHDDGDTTESSQAETEE
ncbi:MAG: TAT-variant-translocated molybdopterin oxidoreductase [Anaerolineae bacterium]